MKHIEPLFTRKIYLFPSATVALMLLLGIALHLHKALLARRIADSYEMREKVLRNSFSELENLAARNECKTFCRKLRQLIQQQLGTVWNCSPEAITYGDIRTKLPGSVKLHDIFLLTDQSAYSNTAIGAQEMMRIIKEARNEMEKLG